jgi:hypothetical protein
MSSKEQNEMLRVFAAVYQSPAKDMQAGEVMRQYDVYINELTTSYSEGGEWYAGCMFYLKSDTKSLDDVKAEIGKNYKVRAKQITLELRKDR